jgi:hypothetical protein
MTWVGNDAPGINYRVQLIKDNVTLETENYTQFGKILLRM